MSKKQHILLIIKYLVVTVSFISELAIAKYNLNENRGIYTQAFITPYAGVTEVCVIPKHFLGVKYRKKDRKDEAMLCSLDFYGKTILNGIPLEYVAICPKSHSTNPAVEVYKIRQKGLTVEEYEQQECKRTSKRRNKSKAKRMAKFKQSISCSYTPSILAYYHLSRILGDIANVAPAVIRTMALEEHRSIAKLGYRVATQSRQRVQALTWKMFIETENHIDSHSNRYGRKYSPLVFTEDNQQIFGAMQKDVKKEGHYRAFYIKNYKNSYRLITSQPFVQKLMSRQSYADADITLLFQLKDYADMLVLDYLLSQEDRYGNVAYKDYYYSVSNDGKITRKQVPEDKKEHISKEMQKNLNIHVVRRLVLKDNDCGVKRYNRTEKSKIMTKIRHMNLDTYQRLLWLNSKIEDTYTETFFKKELLFSSRDWEIFERLVKKLTKILQGNCRKGRLKLDLNPEKKLLDKPYQASLKQCEFPTLEDLMLQ